jgi:hypothetical protein
MQPFDDVQELAAALRREGMELHARDLEHAHDGIFNGTELWVTWRYYVERALHLPELTSETRAQARALFDQLDAGLR